MNDPTLPFFSEIAWLRQELDMPTKKALMSNFVRTDEGTTDSRHVLRVRR